MAYDDRNLTCVECNSEFVFSADDQQFHAEREYQEPKRCPSCRQAKRAGGGGGGGGYGGGGSRQMYDAVCADCGSACQVPFLPTQDRPVYCSDCFSKHKPSR
ncbi:MAG: zinc-ribbon domain containing protein [Chloroflexi bacterium]|nr:zinc-ribbon domain containing protein [Chloroflexota bacterium]